MIESADFQRLSLRNTTFCGILVLCISSAVWLLPPVLGYDRAIMVLTIAGFGGATVGLQFPALGFISLALLCTTDPIARNMLMASGGLIRYNTFNYFLLVVMLLGCPLLLRIANLHVRLLQALIALLFLGLTWSPNLRSGILHILSVVTIYGLIFFVQRAVRCAHIWFWVGCVCGVNAILATGWFYILEPVYLDKNALAYVSLAAIFLLCVSHICEPTRSVFQIYINAFLCVTNVALVAVSASRGGTLTALLCLVCFIAGTKQLAHRVLMVGVALGLLVLVAGMFPEKLEYSIMRFQRLANSEVSIKSRTSGRSDLMKGAWKMFQASPLGVGTGGFGYNYAIISVDEPEIRYAQGRERPSHSAWLKIMSENGVPGLLLLIAYVFSFVLAGITSRKLDYFMLGMCCTGTLSVAFITGEFQLKAVWLIAACSTVILHHRPSRLVSRPLETVPGPSHEPLAGSVRRDCLDHSGRPVLV